MPIKQVTSSANQHVKDMKALEMRKYRKETGLFLAEGLRSVTEGINNGWAPHMLAYIPKDGDMLLTAAINACLENGGLCLEVNEQVLEKLSRKDNPQQVIGVFKQRFASVDALKGAPCVVALEQVRDPGNLGTIIRTVDGAGAGGVILVGQCCDPYSVEAIRATMGSVFSVPIVQMDEAGFLKYMATWPGISVGTALNDRTVDFRQVEYRAPVMIVMGNEQAGLTPTMQGAVKHLVKLPMAGRADSLNLSIATGVMLYAVMAPWKA